MLKLIFVINMGIFFAVNASADAKLEIKLGNWYTNFCTYEIIAIGNDEDTGPWYISPEELFTLAPSLETKDGSHVISPVRMKTNPYEWVGAHFMAPKTEIVKHFNPDDWASERAAKMKAGTYKCPVQPAKGAVIHKIKSENDTTSDPNEDVVVVEDSTSAPQSKPEAEKKPKNLLELIKKMEKPQEATH